jgi:hypothetical protein
MNRILFFEFWNSTPHLQTSLELSYKLSDKNEIFFLFGGHTVNYIENVNFKYNDERDLPEIVGARLIKNSNIKFQLSVKFPKVSNENLSLPTSLSEILNYKYKDFSVGRAAASSLMYELGHSMPNPIEYLDHIREIIISGIQVYEYAKKFILNNKINETYVFNGRFCNQAAVAAAANSLGIKVLYHERGANKDKFYLEEFVPHDMLEIQKRILEVWNTASLINSVTATTIASEFFENSRNGKEMGWKSFITNQQKGCLPNLNKKKKIITYFSSSDDEYAALTDICKWRYWPNQFAAIKSLIKICQECSFELYIRLHPNLKNKHPEDVQKWRDLEHESFVSLIPPESSIDTYKLIEESSVVVVSGTTVGIESVYWGTPCINLGPSYYSELGAVYQPNSDSELKSLLMSSELEAHKEKALPYGYYFNSFGNNFTIFKPIDLDSGTFMGVDINNTPRKLSTIEKFVRHLRFKSSS